MNAITHTYWLLAGAAALVLAGVGTSLLARRFGAPLLLAFLGVGMLAGSDGLGLVRFGDYSFTYHFGSLALAVILFDGGVRTRIEAFRGVVAPTLLLATAGVLITATLTGLFARELLHLPLVDALLVGAVVASTDAAAVFFLLRSSGLQLRKRVGATLEIESSANDPVAVMLTMLLATWLVAPDEHGVGAIVLELVLQFGVGGLLGLGAGSLIVAALRRLPLTGGLAALSVLTAIVLLFGVTGLLHGSGFLAVYVAGVTVGNRRVPGYGELLSVLDAATWLCQILMFLVLGLLAVPHAMIGTLWPGLAIAAFLMLVGRPLAVVACLAPFGYGKREIGFIAWVGLRGAVGIFLASVPMLMRLPHAAEIFNVAFVVVVVSLLVQGWTLGRAARLLNVALPRREHPVRRVELDLPGSLERELVGYPVARDASVLGGAALPGWAQLAMVVREGRILMPDTAASLRSGDYAYLLAPPGRLYRLDWLFAPAEEAGEAEREVFGQFTFDGDVLLGEVAAFYGQKVRTREAALSLADHFAARYEYTVQIGDRLQIASMRMIVRELADDRVARVGLQIVGSPGALADRVRRRGADLLRRLLRRGRRADAAR